MRSRCHSCWSTLILAALLAAPLPGPASADPRVDAETERPEAEVGGAGSADDAKKRDEPRADPGPGGTARAAWAPPGFPLPRPERPTRAPEDKHVTGTHALTPGKHLAWKADSVFVEGLNVTGTFDYGDPATHKDNRATGFLFGQSPRRVVVLDSTFTDVLDVVASIRTRTWVYAENVDVHNLGTDLFKDLTGGYIHNVTVHSQHPWINKRGQKSHGDLVQNTRQAEGLIIDGLVCRELAVRGLNFKGLKDSEICNVVYHKHPGVPARYGGIQFDVSKTTGHANIENVWIHDCDLSGSVVSIDIPLQYVKNLTLGPNLKCSNADRLRALAVDHHEITWID